MSELATHHRFQYVDKVYIPEDSYPQGAISLEDIYNILIDPSRPNVDKEELPVFISSYVKDEFNYAIQIDFDGNYAPGTLKNYLAMLQAFPFTALTFTSPSKRPKAIILTSPDVPVTDPKAYISAVTKFVAHLCGNIPVGKANACLHGLYATHHIDDSNSHNKLKCYIPKDPDAYYNSSATPLNVPIDIMLDLETRRCPPRAESYATGFERLCRMADAYKVLGLTVKDVSDIAKRICYMCVDEKPENGFWKAREIEKKLKDIFTNTDNVLGYDNRVLDEEYWPIKYRAVVSHYNSMSSIAEAIKAAGHIIYYDAMYENLSIDGRVYSSPSKQLQIIADGHLCLEKTSANGEDVTREPYILSGELASRLSHYYAESVHAQTWSEFHELLSKAQQTPWDKVERLRFLWRNCFTLSPAHDEHTQEYEYQTALYLYALLIRRGTSKAPIKSDEIIILCGASDAGKGTFVRNILGSNGRMVRESMDYHEYADVQRFCEQMYGAIIAELEEIDITTRADERRFTKYASASNTTHRRPYKEVPTVSPKRWVDVGTMNDDAIIRSSDAVRRRIFAIRIAGRHPTNHPRKYLEDNVIQLLAEALHAIDNGYMLPSENDASTMHEYMQETSSRLFDNIMSPDRALAEEIKERLGAGEYLEPLSMYGELVNKKDLFDPNNRVMMIKAIKLLGGTQEKDKKGNSIWRVIIKEEA